MPSFCEVSELEGYSPASSFEDVSEDSTVQFLEAPVMGSVLGSIKRMSSILNGSSGSSSSTFCSGSRWSTIHSEEKLRFTVGEFHLIPDGQLDVDEEKCARDTNYREAIDYLECVSPNTLRVCLFDSCKTYRSCVNVLAGKESSVNWGFRVSVGEEKMTFRVKRSTLSKLKFLLVKEQEEESIESSLSFSSERDEGPFIV